MALELRAVLSPMVPLWPELAVVHPEQWELERVQLGFRPVHGMPSSEESRACKEKLKVPDPLVVPI